MNISIQYGRIILIANRWFSQSVQPKKSVYISLSTNIYRNLALEDWFYRNLDFTNQHLLLLWKNDPCVLIGTFQNPWLETNSTQLTNIGSGISLARRRSGGGTVFQDNGNLNLTFFTSRKNYNKERNLEFIVKLLVKNYNVPVQISSKSDLTLHNDKISGSAFRLGSNNAYHHCSLLVHADKRCLEMCLKKCKLNINTNATKSIRSNITNLNEHNRQITVENLIKDFQREFLAYNGGQLRIIAPREQAYPGLDVLSNQMSSWEWIYGKTPKFRISKSDNDVGNILLVVDKARIEKINIEYDDIVTTNENNQLLKEFIGQQFHENIFHQLKESILKQREVFGNGQLREIG